MSNVKGITFSNLIRFFCLFVQNTEHLPIADWGLIEVSQFQLFLV